MKARALIFDAPVGYANAVRMQEKIHAARLAGKIPDTVLLMQHKPVVTLGRRGRDNYLTVPPAELARRGIDYHRSSRGGDITCHGPGQWVIYPILKLSGAEAGAHGYLWQLEEIAIRTAGDFGAQAYRRAGMNGAWTEQGKIAAIGFHIKRWVTKHGMSFNACSTPTAFELIVPCGLEGEPVASLDSILKDACPPMRIVGESLLRNFGEVCGREMEAVEAGKPSADLALS